MSESMPPDPTQTDIATPTDGLSLAPFRALRYAVGPERLGELLCPPYDVIDATERLRLLGTDEHNAVALVLPVAPDRNSEPKTGGPDAGADPGPDPYLHAAELLTDWTADGVLRVDNLPALYIYEMRTDPADGTPGSLTRGLLGAVELRNPADGVILPHENTMAGPVADRLALMVATEANLEPIYLVYEGGGPASQVVADVDDADAIATAQTPDGTTHRLWAITDPRAHDAVEGDLSLRRALIADGHHRYATYRQLQHHRQEIDGGGPWDRGLALLVDTSAYGPEVHPIHRVLAGLDFDTAVEQAVARLSATPFDSYPEALSELDHAGPGFHAVITDGARAALIGPPQQELLDAHLGEDEPTALLDLDVTVLHRVVISDVWGLPDDETIVRYAHSADEAIGLARELRGTAVLLRATPVEAVAAVAAAGARMPRKSTLFTPKPASGLVIRRFADQDPQTDG
ncbi:MAG: DUF1015 domain-containing protein [Jatrophihabitans sp.]